MAIVSGLNDIKHIYVGDNYIRSVYDGPNLVWGGYPTSLTTLQTRPAQMRYQAAATMAASPSSVIAVGGVDHSLQYANNIITTIYPPLSVGTATSFPTNVYNMRATSISTHAIFAQGGTGSMQGGSIYNTAYAFGPYSERTALSSLSMYNSAALAFNNYAMYFGGHDGSYNAVSTVQYFNTSLVRSTAPAMSSSRKYHGVATVGGYALVAGGTNSSGTDTATVDAYNTSLVRSSASALSYADHYTIGGSVGSYALFSRYSNYGLDVYDANLVKTTVASGTASNYGHSLTVTAAPHMYSLFSGQIGVVSHISMYNELLTYSAIQNVDYAHGMAQLGTKIFLFLENTIKYLEIK